MKEYKEISKKVQFLTSKTIKKVQFLMLKLAKKVQHY